MLEFTSNRELETLDSGTLAAISVPLDAAFALFLHRANVFRLKAFWGLSCRKVVHSVGLYVGQSTFGPFSYVGLGRGSGHGFSL
jgi:hypothetical protein